MTALTLDLKAWINIRKKEMKESERKQGKKRKIGDIPIIKSCVGLFMEKGTWPVEQCSTQH